MGKLIVFQWYYISVWSDEPIYEYEHVHVFRSKSKQVTGAKFKLEPLELINQGDFSSNEIKWIEEDIKGNIGVIKSQLNELKEKGQVKAIKIKKKGK
ncbi:MAG: hypothetical protein ABII90_01845 [Bacteroidota bacterium]